jgi:ubiquinone/menaquinone biosynthesis C-methylase UbiE
VYKTATQLWEEHISSFDGAIGEHNTCFKLFVDGGCGNERFVERYSGLFENCIGIDRNIQPRNNDKGNTHFIQGDLESLPLKSESVDVFLTNFVLEHIKDPQSFFSEVKRVIKPQGLLIIWTPNLNSASGFLLRVLPSHVKEMLKRYYYSTCFYPAYYQSNSPTKLDSILNNTGFEKVKLELKDGVFYFSNLKLVRWVHSFFIKVTECEGLTNFKDLIFAVYSKSRSEVSI